MKTCQICRDKKKVKTEIDEFKSCENSSDTEQEIKCPKCKKERDIEQFMKNDKQLKTCVICRDKKQQWKTKNKQDLKKCEEEGKTWEELKEL